MVIDKPHCMGNVFTRCGDTIMTLQKAKTKMLLYRDFYGQDFVDTEAIKNARTKADLNNVIRQHERFLELQLGDAMNHLKQLSKDLKL